VVRTISRTWSVSTTRSLYRFSSAFAGRFDANC
jgi:hypothetical protein